MPSRAEVSVLSARHAASSAPLAQHLADRVTRIRQEMAYSDTTRLVILTGAVLVLTVAGLISPEVVPFSSLLIPMYVASLWLGPRALPWLVGLAVAGVLVLVVVDRPSPVRVLITLALAALILVASLRRSRLGIAGSKGESMLVELRDRLIDQGTIGELPESWYAQSVLRSAGGTLFAGDFVIARTAPDGSVLDVAVVDVSGKGVAAGTRSLLLSGAFGGLLGALPAADFLPAANQFLLEQDWEEGFATAIHLHLDLRTGRFEVRKAGHPPAVWLHAGSGRQQVLASDGPALGLIPGAEFDRVRGVVLPGDGLMLYTDGLVEDAQRDMVSGIDRLAGRGQQLLQEGFDGAAGLVVDELERVDDDRALLLVHRRR